MPNYRRAIIPGGCFFFTVNLLERRQTLLVDQIGGLREAVVATRRSHPFMTDAFVVLPDHLHAVWTLPPGASDFSTRGRLIRSRFAKAMPKRERLTGIRQARGERGIWQRRFYRAYDPQRSRRRAPYRILLYQPGQAPIGRACS
jgi:REP-associated tyrosine transposase